MRRINGMPIMEFKTDEDINCAQSYFGCLRELIGELRDLDRSQTHPSGELVTVADVLAKYKVEFLDEIDEIPRVSLEKPKGGPKVKKKLAKPSEIKELDVRQLTSYEERLSSKEPLTKVERVELVDQFIHYTSRKLHWLRRDLDHLYAVVERMVNGEELDG